MVLRDDSDDAEVDEGLDGSGRFLYARVLGIFHTNVVYLGSRMQDYQTRRLEFLWVRWFQPSFLPGSWDSRHLDTTKFLPVADPQAFGFLDPAEVIRACHILPRISLGKVHEDRGLSKLAMDKDDWQYYYINRYGHLFLYKMLLKRFNS